MTKQNIEYIGSQLEARGYKKWTTCKTSDNTDYEYMKTVKPQNYIISFRVWDFEKYRIRGGYCLDVDIVYPFDYKRIDIIINHDDDINRIEHLAQENYVLLNNYYRTYDINT